MKTDKEPTEGILEKELFKITKKATGGPVLSGVDQYILNRYK